MYPNWSLLSWFVIKHHPSDLLYLFFNLDEQIGFLTIWHFLPKPVFFKNSIRQNLVLDALHCGIFYVLKNNISFNFFANTVIANISAFI